MVCDPADNSLNIPVLAPPVGPFGIPFAPPAIPFPDLALPDGIPEDLLDLVRRLLAAIPGGPLRANVDNFAKDVLDIIASLLNQLGPYFALYRFFQALLNMIGCIMDIICCLSNPFCMVRAIRKLFKRCLPDFLNLFPWLALLAMIIALLLLLLALIQYLLEQIAKLIQDLIENLLLLARAFQIDATEDDITAAAIKIAQLLCLIEQLFAILIAFQAILAIIEALAQVAGRTFCGSSGDIGGDDIECCGDEFCPPFIKQNEEGLSGTLGRLIYHREIQNSPLTGQFSSLALPSVRGERWQFVDDKTQEFNFKDIITPINEFIYWPEGKSYDRITSPKKVPYTLDLTLNNIDPATFGHSDPVGGARTFIIKNIIVTIRPNIGIVTFDDTVDTSNSNGTLRIEGGDVFEADGTTPFLINGVQSDLNSFIHFDPGIGVPSVEDSFVITNVEYLLKFNHEVLVQETLITLGCIPEVAIERDIANIVVPNIQPVINLLAGGLPDVQGAIECLEDSLAKFRQDVSVDNAAVMQAEMEACLNDLNNQTLDTYNDAVINGTNVFQSTVELDPEVQFVSSEIKVSVVLKDSSGTTISFSVPETSQTTIASLITAEVTLGQISGFEFDVDNDAFVAFISSDESGEGELRVSFNGNVLSIVLDQDDDDAITSIEENVSEYRFVGTAIRGGIAGEPEQLPRRDEGDVASDE